MKQQFYTQHVLEFPCGLDVKCVCISFYQLQYCNIACVLDYKPFLYKCRCTIIITTVVYIIINLFYYKLEMFLFCFCLVSLHDD